MSDSVSLSRRSLLTAAAGGAALAATGAAIRTATAAAPMLGPSRPNVCRFKLGGFEVTTIFDGAIALDGPHPIFGQNVPAAEVEALAEENLLPAKRMEIGFTPVLVNTGSELILFDSGNGAAHPMPACLPRPWPRRAIRRIRSTLSRSPISIPIISAG